MRKRRKSRIAKKDENWLSAADLGQKFSASASPIQRILKRLQPIDSRPGFMVDSDARQAWRVEKRSNVGRYSLCLCADDAASFGKCYGLDVPKTGDWLSVHEIVDYFSTRTQSRLKFRLVHGIMRRLEYHYHKRDPVSDEIWQIAERQHRSTKILCLHISELDRFGKHYHLDAPAKQGDWLSPEEIAERLQNSDDYRYKQVLCRLQPTVGAFVMRDPIKGVDWRVRIFNVKGKPLPCLHSKELESFASCYRRFKSDNAPATLEWLSAQDLADYLDAADSQRIQAILDRLEPAKDDRSLSGKTDYMYDAIKDCVWHVQVLRTGDVFSRFLHDSQVEPFIRKYLLHKLSKKQPPVPFRPLELWCD